MRKGGGFLFPLKTRPILFSGAMVRAILSGSKTQTRRVVKPCKKYLPELSIVEEFVHGPVDEVWTAFRKDAEGDNEPLGGIVCPFGQEGCKLWVRETHAIVDSAPYADGQSDETALYKADWKEGIQPRWRPSIHMPRWASRITLEVASVRVERLQEISETDAVAEGVKTLPAPQWRSTWRDTYCELWEQINGPGSWQSNSWVWVVEFKRVEA